VTAPTQRQLEDAIFDIEARPLRRAEKDALAEPLARQLNEVRAAEERRCRLDLELARALIALKAQT